MLCAFKKTLAVCLIGLGLGILLVLLLPICRLVIYYWSNNSLCWFYVASMLDKKGGMTYDSRSKKSS